MKGNFHVRFLGGCGRATARTYPISILLDYEPSTSRKRVRPLTMVCSFSCSLLLHSALAETVWYARVRLPLRVECLKSSMFTGLGTAVRLQPPEVSFLSQPLDLDLHHTLTPFLPTFVEHFVAPPLSADHR